MYPSGKSGCRTQIITSAHQTLDLSMDFIEFNRLDWKPDSLHKHTCGVYMLEINPKFPLPVGKRITFTNLDKQTNILGSMYENKYGDFWHITLSEANETVTLEWTNKGIVGWTIAAMTPSIHVHRLRGRSSVAYIPCTVRRIEGNPNFTRDFLATVDIDPLSPTYSTILDVSWGSESGFKQPGIPGDYETVDPGIEYHHGGLIETSGGMVFVCGSLRWDTAATPRGGSYVDVHQLFSKKNPVKSTRCDAIEVAMAGGCAVHTIRQNPFTGGILATYLGTSGTGTPATPDSPAVPASGAGGLLSIKTNFLAPEIPGLGVSNYHTIGADTEAEYGITQLVEGPDKYVYDFAVSHCERKMVITSWGPPLSFDPSFDPSKPYGTSIRVYDMPPPGGPTVPGAALKFIKLFTAEKVMEMGGTNPNAEGIVPLEVRKLNDPHKEIYFVSITLPGAVDLIYKDDSGIYQKRVALTPKQIADACSKYNLRDGSSIPEGCPRWAVVGNMRVPLVTDITLSNDDTMYVSCWLGGAVLQCDIKNPFDVKIIDGVGNLGGVRSISPPTNVFNTASRVIKGKQFNGGSQMLRTSPDGRMLYITNSLFSGWDKQFYPPGPGSMETYGCNMIAIKTGVIDGIKKAPCEVDETFGITSQAINVILPNGEKGVVKSRMHEVHIEGVPH